MKTTNQRDAMHYIASREEFKASALTGSTYSLGGTGRLSGQDLERFYQDVNGLDYLVYSYATPIAWHTLEGWYLVGQKFSPTTSKHQSTVRRALSEALAVA